MLTPYSMEQGVFRDQVFSRLRWDVFGNFIDIEVENESSAGELEISAFEGHPITTENATDPSVSRIEVRIDVLEWKSAEDEQEEEFRYQPPDPLIIEHEGGSPITVGDFVTSVHAYLQENKAEIIAAKLSELSGEEVELGDGWRATGVGTESEEPNAVATTQFLFDGVVENNWDPSNLCLAVEIYAVGEDGKTAEEYWKSR